MEYLRAFLIGRTGWSRVGALMIVSGAFGLFRRDVVVEVGGLDVDCIGEDFELVTKIHRRMRDERRDYRVVFVSEPVSWTEVPPTRAVLASQRRRWHRGLWEVLWKHRRMALNGRYGRIGLVGLPYFWLFELIAPALEFFGVVIVPLGLVLGVGERDVRGHVRQLRLRLRHLRQHRRAVPGGVLLPPLPGLARPGHRRRGVRPGERRLPPAHGVVAAAGLVGRPAREPSGVGHHDPRGLRRRRRRTRSGRIGTGARPKVPV